MKAPKGRFDSLIPADVDFTRRWVFPTDTTAEQAIELFDRIKAAPLTTLEESEAALKMLDELHDLLEKMGMGWRAAEWTGV